MKLATYSYFGGIIIVVFQLVVILLSTQQGSAFAVLPSTKKISSHIPSSSSPYSVKKVKPLSSNKNRKHFSLLWTDSSSHQSHTNQSPAKKQAGTFPGSVVLLPFKKIVQRIIMSISKVHVGLFLFYWLLLGNVIFPNILPANNYVCSLIFGTLWLGFVLAISGMEAWLKFRAPFCPKGFALDIGRTIFPALNSVEVGLCLTCWQSIYFQQQQQARVSGGVLSFSLSSSSSLPLVTAILILDVLWLTPKLVRRGKEVVYQHIKTQGGARPGSTETAEYLALEEEMKSQAFSKQDKGHIVYVALEFVKMVGLGKFIVEQAKNIVVL